jgi:hypothetical protein
VLFEKRRAFELRDQQERVEQLEDEVRSPGQRLQ